MQRGVGLPLVLILVLFLTIPLLFWFVSSKDSSPNVKGVSVNGKSGFAIKIRSEKGTWDLYQYLCESKRECVTSPFSGDKLDAISGGKTLDHEIVVSKTSDWIGYEYVKVFVKPGWGSPDRAFEGKNLSDNSKINIQRISYEGSTYDVFLIPLSSIQNTFSSYLQFSDL